MTVSTVGSMTRGGNTSGSNTAISVVTDSGKQIGDFVIVAIQIKGATSGGVGSADANGWDAGAFIGSPTVTAPDGTWTLLGDQQLGATGHVAFYYKTASTAGVSTYAFTLSSGNVHTWLCRVYRGAAGVTKLGSGKATTATGLTTAAITTTEANEYVLRLLGGVVSSGSTTELGVTWDGATTKLTDVQGAGAGTGLVFGSASEEVVATAGSVTGRSITLPNTPAGTATVTLGITIAAQSPPVNTVAPAITGTAKQGQTGTCSTGTWSGNPTPTYAYQWNRNGTAISGATSNLYVYQASDVGQSITCTVTATNASGAASQTSGTVTPVTALPVNTVAPAISGTAAQGQTGTCSQGTWSNTPTGYTYQWLRAGVAISGATASTYVYTSSDVGQAITCTVTATNAYGSTSANSSNSVTPIGPPTINVAPVITGTFNAGQTLTCSTGSWNGTPTSYAYQWQRNGANIPSASASTYVLTQADVAQNITCIVTATNAGGSTSATSNTIIGRTSTGLSWNTLGGSRFSSGIWH